MPLNLRKGFRLGPWTIEPLRGAISGPDNDIQHIEPKVMEVLVLLAADATALVTREQLLEAVWDRHVAADQLLTRAISELRRTLHDRRSDPVYIETVPKRGYRLICDVRPLNDSHIAEEAVLPQPVSSLRKHRSALIAILALALGSTYFAFNYFSGHWGQDQESGADAQFVKFGPFVDTTMSIAVLPFANISEDPGNALFSDGLSEEIRNLLAKIPNLKVIGRTSSFAFKGKNEDIRDIGRMLGVETVLEGSVRKSGDRLRITTQLIDVTDGSEVWSRTYDRTMTDIFDLQEDVAAAILDALEVRIGSYPMRGRPTEIPEAYALFLKARVALNEQDGRTAETALREALKLDPKFAEAFELLAHVYWTESIPDLEPAEEQKRTRRAAARALEIDPDLALARAFYVESDPENYSWLDVLDADIAAVRKDPGNPVILRTLSWNLLISGYLSKALQVAEKWVAVDPLSKIARIRYAAALRAVGRHDAARASLKAAVPLASQGELDWYFGQSFLSENDDETAIQYFESSVRQTLDIEAVWVSDLITGGRNPISGRSYLDENIPVIIRSISPDKAENWRHTLQRLYLYFGYLDRYFEVLLENDPSYATWSEGMYYVWEGTLHRDMGFTAHPRYLEVAEKMGFIDVWEQRGPPDFCEKAGDRWRCW